jgi:hypothetical protein
MLTNRILIKSNLTPAQLSWVADNVKDVTLKYYLGWIINIIVHFVLIGLLWQIFQGNDEYSPSAHAGMIGYAWVWIYFGLSSAAMAFTKGSFRQRCTVVNQPIWRTNKYILLVEDLLRCCLTGAVCGLAFLAGYVPLSFVAIAMYLLFVLCSVYVMSDLTKTCKENIPINREGK